MLSPSSFCQLFKIKPNGSKELCLPQINSDPDGCEGSSSTHVTCCHREGCYWALPLISASCDQRLVILSCENIFESACYLTTLRPAQGQSSVISHPDESIHLIFASEFISLKNQSPSGWRSCSNPAALLAQKWKDTVNLIRQCLLVYRALIWWRKEAKGQIAVLGMMLLICTGCY